MDTETRRRVLHLVPQSTVVVSSEDGRITWQPRVVDARVPVIVVPSRIRVYRVDYGDYRDVDAMVNARTLAAINRQTFGYYGFGVTCNGEYVLDRHALDVLDALREHVRRRPTQGGIESVGNAECPAHWIITTH